MKFVLTGDWHLRFKRPENRTDEDYLQTQLDKIEQIFDICRDEGAILLQPGDFFDSPDCPFHVLWEFIEMWKKSGVEIFCVAGQHDLRYRSKNLKQTALGILSTFNDKMTIEWINEAVFRLENRVINLSAAGWGREILKPFSKVDINILITHRMVIKNEGNKLWPGQTDYITAQQLLKKYPYDLFVCGDNHKSFIVSENGRHVVNCGSLMRTNKDQVDHKPIVYLYDTETRGLDPIELDVKPAQEVFNFNKIEEEENRNEMLDAFVEGLNFKKGGEYDLEFTNNLYRFMDDNDVGEGVRSIVEEVLEKVGG